MGYSIEAITNDCYEGTSCLINKLDVMEAHITLAKISILQQTPLDGNFDFEHYKAIHKYIFEDLYDWAGRIRTVNLSKKGTSFVKAEMI